MAKISRWLGQWDLGHQFNQRFAANSKGISPIINAGIKIGIGPSGLGNTVNGLMELGYDGESSPIHIDIGKSVKGLWSVFLHL